MKMFNRVLAAAGAMLVVLAVLSPRIALAQGVLDSGDTAWVMTSTALVLFMTIPGAVAVLRWHGAGEECPVGDDAVLRHNLSRDRAVGVVRLQSRLRRRRRVDR